jgi:NitT/TauT family transport system substrate-binding protein
MKALRAALILAMATAISGCAGSVPTSPSPTAAALSPGPAGPEASGSASAAPSADPVDGASISVVYSSDSIGVNDYPTKMAWDTLTERGMNVDLQFVAESELAVQALIRGDVEIAHSTPPIAINANQSDPTIKAFNDYKRQSWSLASQPSIERVEDLAGKTIAVHGETSFTKRVADLIIEEYNLQDVEVVIIPGSEVRAQALLSGQIDATVLDVQDVLNVLHQEPGSIKELVSFGQRFPDLTSGRWIADSDWVDANHEVAKEVLKELINANRRAVADPEATIAEAQAYYTDENPEIIEATIRAFIENDLWTLNGGVTEETALEELQFYIDGGQTTLEATPENVQRAYMFDLQNEVLDEIGRE